MDKSKYRPYVDAHVGQYGYHPAKPNAALSEILGCLAQELPGYNMRPPVSGEHMTPGSVLASVLNVDPRASAGGHVLIDKDGNIPERGIGVGGSGFKAVEEVGRALQKAEQICQSRRDPSVLMC